MRALLLALVLVAGRCAAEDWAPLDTRPHEAKLAEYIGYGWSRDEIIAGLRRWFGWNFDIAPDGRTVLIAWLRPDGEVYFMQKIGILPESR
jgi:hypothetical protein